MSNMQQAFRFDDAYDNGPLFNQPIKRAARIYGTVIPGILRRQVERQRRPKWQSWSGLVKFWIEATKLTHSTGIVHSVDHIVPLQHPLVCGLHCEANLQIVPLSANLRKSNKYWPGEQKCLDF